VLRIADRALRVAPLLLMLVIAIAVAPLSLAVNCQFACQTAMSVPSAQCAVSMTAPSAIVPAGPRVDVTSLVGFAPSAPAIVLAPVQVAFRPDAFAPESPPIDPLGTVIRI
jgi:hypothetical protein